MEGRGIEGKEHMEILQVGFPFRQDIQDRLHVHINPVERMCNVANFELLWFLAKSLVFCRASVTLIQVAENQANLVFT